MSKSVQIDAEKPAGISTDVLRIRQQLSEARVLTELPAAHCALSVSASEETIWITLRRPGRGGLALRAIPPSGPMRIAHHTMRPGGGEWTAHTAAGVFTVGVSLHEHGVLHVTTTLTPAADLLVPYWPRDLFALDANDDPRETRGRVEAAQRGLNIGVCYFCMEEPAFGNVLYLQDLTRLNPFFLATDSKPDGVIGGAWPELGYLASTSLALPAHPTKPLKTGKPVVISDAYLALDETCAPDETGSAAAFLNLLARIYPHIEKTPPEPYDWFERAERTLRDLTTASVAHVECDGHLYLHPYTAAEYPDCMVQMSVIRPLFEYGRAIERDIPLVETLFAGMECFYDDKLQTLRRYLPNVGDDKNENAVDSWYLYHPLLNLGRMALAGHKGAEKLLLKSLGYGIRAAQHFNYDWPIQFDVRNFEIIRKARDEEGRFGQTDVGGIYAYVMLQAYQLTHDQSYLLEARAALRALESLRFNLVYQTNLTAWGAAACAKLYEIDGDRRWLNQSHVFIAGFIHNCAVWNSEIGHASNFANFFGATCLHDAPYMAAYECYESFDAFREYLASAGEAVLPSAKLLLESFCAYTLHRARYFFPDELPAEAVASENIRNGYIDRTLSFPLEDLYCDGQPAGQVGQEVYGCGAAFVLAAFLAKQGQHRAAQEPIEA